MISDFLNECKTVNCSGIFECLRKPHGAMCVCPKGTYFSNNTCYGKLKIF